MKVRPMYTSRAIRNQQGTSEPLHRSTSLFGHMIPRNRAVRETGLTCPARAGCSVHPVHVRACLSLHPRVSLARRAHRNTKRMRISGETTSVLADRTGIQLPDPDQTEPIYGAPYFVGDSGTGVPFSIGSDRRFGRGVSNSSTLESSSERKCVCQLRENRSCVTDNQFRSTP